MSAFALSDPAEDAVLLLNLPPGNCTALVNGVGNTTGGALAEVHEAPCSGSRAAPRFVVRQRTKPLARATRRLFVRL